MVHPEDLSLPELILLLLLLFFLCGPFWTLCVKDFHVGDHRRDETEIQMLSRSECPSRHLQKVALEYINADLKYTQGLGLLSLHSKHIGC